MAYKLKMSLKSGFLYFFSVYVSIQIRGYFFLIILILAIMTLAIGHLKKKISGKRSQDQWSIYLQVVDAMGKPPSELLDYQLTWLGSYDECVAIHAQVNNTYGQLTSPFKGRYCAAAFPLGPGGQVVDLT